MTSKKFPINFIIPILSEEEAKVVEKFLTDAVPSNTFLTKSYYEHQDESQRARLMINGEEVKRGSVEQMKNAYKLQSDMNQKINIAVQEWQKPLVGAPKFVTIMSRLVRMR